MAEAEVEEHEPILEDVSDGDTDSMITKEGRRKKIIVMMMMMKRSKKK